MCTGREPVKPEVWEIILLSFRLHTVMFLVLTIYYEGLALQLISEDLDSPAELPDVHHLHVSLAEMYTHPSANALLCQL